MTRKIYEKSIYTTRPNQLDRKVYKRANNVIPVYGDTYSITSMTLVDGGTGYTANEELEITGAEGDTPAVITVKTVSNTIYSVNSAEAAGTMSGYVDGETITIAGAEGDTPAILTLNVTEGAVSSITVTEAGLFASDISGNITEYTYEGEGTGLELSVTTVSNAGGTILTFEFTAGSYETDISGEIELAGATGTGAKFTVVAERPISEETEE